jgi:hypothetical protein
MSLIRSIYHAVVSEGLRYKLYHRKRIKLNKKLVDNVISYLRSPGNIFPKDDSAEICAFLKENGLHVFPYNFTKKYKPEDIGVMFDSQTSLHYVMYSGKRLYFKRDWSPEKIKFKFSFLLNEQDPVSPHQYLSDDFTVCDGDTVADAGAAEGIFVLPLVDKIKHAYLFETDEEWLEALNATFAPYKDKITIINKYVSNKNDSMNVSLDEYFKNKKLDFIKIDVDGAERDLLDGAKTILSQSDPIKIAICTYHNQNDEKEFDTVLRSHKFTTSTSGKYMLFYYDDNLAEPYLRRGILRAKK